MVWNSDTTLKETSIKLLESYIAPELHRGQKSKWHSETETFPVMVMESFQLELTFSKVGEHSLKTGLMQMCLKQKVNNWVQKDKKNDFTTESAKGRGFLSGLKMTSPLPVRSTFEMFLIFHIFYIGPTSPANSSSKSTNETVIPKRVPPCHAKFSS